MLTQRVGLATYVLIRAPSAKHQASSTKLLKIQATSVKLDMKDFMGYIINDGKSHTLYAGNDILFIRNLLPDTGNGSLKILRNSAAEALEADGVLAFEAPKAGEAAVQAAA